MSKFLYFVALPLLVIVSSLCIGVVWYDLFQSVRIYETIMAIAYTVSLVSLIFSLAWRNEGLFLFSKYAAYYCSIYALVWQILLWTGRETTNTFDRGVLPLVFGIGAGFFLATLGRKHHA